MTDIVERERLMAMGEISHQMAEMVGAPPAPPIVVKKPSKIVEKVRLVAPPLIGLMVLLGVYWFFHHRLESRRKFLMPWFGDLWSKGLADGETNSELFEALRLTARVSFQGLAISIIIGSLLGIAMFRFRVLERASYPFLVALQAIPVLAIAPLLQVGFGYGLWPKTLVCVIISFFPIPTTLLLGLRSVDRGQVDLFRLQGASWTTTLRKLAIPSALPSLFAGLRIAAGLSVIGAIVGELQFQGGADGLGAKLVEYRREVHYEQMYAGLVWSSLLGIGVFVFFSWLGNRLFSQWHESGQLDK
jgi:NitT/TauT family transport system permease protein